MKEEKKKNERALSCWEKWQREKERDRWKKKMKREKKKKKKKKMMMMMMIRRRRRMLYGLFADLVAS